MSSSSSNRSTVIPLFPSSSVASATEDHHYASVAVDSRRAAAHRLHGSDPGTLHLTAAGLAAKVPDTLRDLGQAGGTQGVAPAEQATRGVDGLTSAEGGVAGEHEVLPAAGLGQAESLGRGDLADREGIVHLEEVHVL